MKEDKVEQSSYKPLVLAKMFRLTSFAQFSCTKVSEVDSARHEIKGSLINRLIKRVL